MSNRVDEVVEKCIEIIRKQCNILVEKKVPTIFASKPDAKDLVMTGSQLALEMLNDKKDELVMVFENDKRRMDTYPDQNVKLLKLPLSLLNSNEARMYCRYLITLDHEERLPMSNEKNIKYGAEEWEASFWPNDMMKWTSSKTNFSDIKKTDIPGEASILDVLKEAIRRGLEAKNLDPEKHYDTRLADANIIKKRQKNRGIQTVMDSNSSSPLQPRRVNNANNQIDDEDPANVDSPRQNLAERDESEEGSMSNVLTTDREEDVSMFSTLTTRSTRIRRAFKYKMKISVKEMRN